MTHRLLKTYEVVDTRDLSDLIYVAAMNVEDAMVTGGLVPGRDYKPLDLYTLAIPIALKLYDDAGNKASFGVGYPSGHPRA